jgi:threonine dehydrogenase-like Zn-dependent dehydrogenase
MGADMSFDAHTGRVVENMLHHAPGGMDVVFECCGEQDALDEALTLLKPGGALVIVGIPQTQRVDFPIDTLRRKELRIYNVRRQNECMQEAVDAIYSGQMDAQCMLTHRFPFERSKEAFDTVAAYHDGVIKAIIYFS